MKWLKKLQHPFALVGQGFLVGALMLWTVQPEYGTSPSAPVEEGSLLSTIQS